MIKLSLQNTWAHKRRLFGTFMAVLIGVGFLSGTLILGDTLRENFTKLFDAGYAGTDVVVRPEKPDDGGNDDGTLQASRTLDASLVDKIEAIDGVRVAVAEVQTFGQLIGRNGETIGGSGPPTFAASWNPDTGINPYHIISGRTPKAPEEVVIDDASAKAGKLKVGDTTTVLLPQPLKVKIVGLARFGEETTAGGVTWAFFSASGTAAHLTKTPGTANQISVAAVDGVSQTELRNRIRPVIGSGNEALTGEAVAKESVDDINSAFLGFLTNFLVAFAGIALFVGTFSIYNTFSIIVAQRTRESALMRAIGATRRQVLTATMVEALVIGVVASVVGLAAGVGVAAGLKGVFDAFGLNLPAGGLTLRSSSMTIGIVVGIVVTVLAAIVPARRGSRVAPVEALRSSAVEDEVPKRARGIAGIVVSVVGIVTIVLAVTLHPKDAEIQIAGIGALLTLIGMLVIGPVAARPVARLLGLPLAKVGGVTGELARENAVRNPRRTASTAAALLVGVAIVVLFSVFIASTKNLVTQTVDRTFGGDLVITSGGFGGATLPPSLPADTEKVDGVERAVGLGFGPMTIAGDTDFISNAHVADLVKLLDLGVTAGSPKAVDDGAIGISKDQAEKDKVGVGDTISLVFPDTTRQRAKIGMVYENADIVGAYLLGTEAYSAHSKVSADAIVFVGLKDGASVSAVRKDLKKLTADIGKPKIEDRAAYTETVGSRLDVLLGLVIVMLALAILIAVMGIANTLALSVYERTRELGVLRAVGTTRRQVRRLVRWESVIVSTFGTVGGVALGAGLGWALVQAAFSDSSTSPFTLPVGNLVLILVLGILVGVGAAALPAYRAAKLEVLGAVSAA
ncbi:MAG: FtsX-like permease family protein [Acidimicrobiales bacterium]